MRTHKYDEADSRFRDFVNVLKITDCSRKTYVSLIKLN